MSGLRVCEGANGWYVAAERDGFVRHPPAECSGAWHSTRAAAEAALQAREQDASDNAEFSFYVRKVVEFCRDRLGVVVSDDLRCRIEREVESEMEVSTIEQLARVAANVWTPLRQEVRS